MKLNGVFGKGTGKVGNSVWAVSGGVQIVRPYNPNVSNPNTNAQIEQRAKLKLMSQLAAALAPGIAFKKQGLVSARNQFIAANISKCVFATNRATIALSVLDLTGGTAAFPEITIESVGGTSLSAKADSAVAANVDAVVYVLAKQNDDSTLEVVDVKLINTPGENRTFPASFANVDGELVCYAYGLFNTSNTSRVSYENYLANISDSEAYLDIVKSLLTTGATATKNVCGSL